jgi:hypothetical protein
MVPDGTTITHHRQRLTRPVDLQFTFVLISHLLYSSLVYSLCRGGVTDDPAPLPAFAVIGARVFACGERRAQLTDLALVPNAVMYSARISRRGSFKPYVEQRSFLARQ